MLCQFFYQLAELNSMHICMDQKVVYYGLYDGIEKEHSFDLF